jgi:hypothetical protein
MADPLEFLALLIDALSWLDVEVLMRSSSVETQLEMSHTKRRQFRWLSSLDPCLTRFQITDWLTGGIANQLKL